MYKQEHHLTNENMDTLEEQNLGPSVLTLQEAISGYGQENNEGDLYKLEIKLQCDERLEFVVRVRCSEVAMAGEPKLILQLSDLTEQVNYQKMKMKEQEQRAS